MPKKTIINIGMSPSMGSFNLEASANFAMRLLIISGGPKDMSVGGAVQEIF